jgi:hypothetical protein
VNYFEIIQIFEKMVKICDTRKCWPRPPMVKSFGLVALRFFLVLSFAMALAYLPH